LWRKGRLSAFRGGQLLRAFGGGRGIHSQHLGHHVRLKTSLALDPASPAVPTVRLSVATPRRSPAITPGCLENNPSRRGVKRKCVPILSRTTRPPGEPCGSTGRFRGQWNRTTRSIAAPPTGSRLGRLRTALDTQLNERGHRLALPPPPRASRPRQAALDGQDAAALWTQQRVAAFRGTDRATMARQARERSPCARKPLESTTHAAAEPLLA